MTNARTAWPAVILLVCAIIAGCTESPSTTAADASGEPAADSPDALQTEDLMPTDSSEDDPGSAGNIAAAEAGGIVQQLQGTWKITASTMSGEAMPSMIGTIAKINDNTIAIEAGGVIMTSVMKFEEDTDPIRFVSTSETGQEGKAILRLDEDQLTVATALLPDADFPHNFDAANGVMVIEYARVTE